MNNTKISLLDMDATKIACDILKGKTTSEAVVRTYIAHIKKVNPSLNAMVEDRFHDALLEAKELDAHNPSKRKGKLYGVPISVKEAYDVRGMKTTGGLINRHDIVAKHDAEVVAKLKKAGAIVLGKTNTPELCFCQETENKLYGRTNNPWDITRTSGGSSGGEGSLLAAGGVAAGIGSDIGGSIRFPAHFNGVVGFKPGNDQVSAQGHFPPTTIPQQQRMLGIGPMGKSVRDMRLLYNIIAKQPAPDRVIEDFHVHVLPPKTNYPLSPKTSNILSNITTFLHDAFGATPAIPPYFHESALLWQEIMSIDGAKTIQRIAFKNDRSQPLAAYIKERTFRTASVHKYLSWAITGASFFKPSAKRRQKINAMLKQGDKELVSYLQKRLLIFPVYHTGALTHGNVYREIFSIKKTFFTIHALRCLCQCMGVTVINRSRRYR
ncbi:MAG TPA: amidase [Bacillota bacterium]|nr:amidase [Bacillota bacterium]